MKKDFRIPFSNVKGMKDEELFWAVIEPIWPDSSVVDELEHICSGTRGQRAIYATTLFIREVDNGGLQQFFWNSAGMFSDEALEGFSLLGLNEYCEVLKQAMSFFPNGKVPLDWEKRRSYLHKRENEAEDYFEPLNDKIYGEERLYQYFHKFIEENPQEFFYDKKL